MRRLTRFAGLALVLVIATGCAGSGRPSTSPTGSISPTAASSSTGGPGPQQDASNLERLLSRVSVVPGATYHPGYDRDCDPGACVFGPPWTDDHPGAFGHNGCDTRQDVLLQQLRDVELRWGSRCRVYDGRLLDPYSGELLTWREDGYWIQVDHLYPLAAAWHAGAWAWSPRRRLRFANDLRRELLAVSARTNQDKGSRTPSDWLPPNRGFRCRYLTKYLSVALAYDLPITQADARVVRRVAPRC